MRLAFRNSAIIRGIKFRVSMLRTQQQGWTDTCSRPGVAQRVSRGIALLFQDRGTRRGWMVRRTPRPHITPGKTRYPLYRRLGGPQDRSGRAENLVPIGIRSRTVQPIVSRYTEWTTRPTTLIGKFIIRFDARSLTWPCVLSFYCAR